ncbi:MAG: hypothetical protein Q9175_003916 [Cornicularia normoerica]
MAGWTRNPFRHEESPSNGIAGHCPASRHLGTTIELEERITSQVEEERTETSRSERAQNATTGSPMNGVNTGPFKRLQDWWSHSVRLNLEHGAPGGDPRDYLALERTFLGWFRTSVALVSLGVVVTQLFILKDLDPKKGKIHGVIMSCGGIIVVLLGCVRYFKQQRLLTQGKVLSGGWHHQVLIMMLLLVLITLFVFVIVDR